MNERRQSLWGKDLSFFVTESGDHFKVLTKNFEVGDDNLRLSNPYLQNFKIIPVDSMKHLYQERSMRIVIQCLLRLVRVNETKCSVVYKVCTYKKTGCGNLPFLLDF